MATILKQSSTVQIHTVERSVNIQKERSKSWDITRKLRPSRKSMSVSETRRSLNSKGSGVSSNANISSKLSGPISGGSSRKGHDKYDVTNTIVGEVLKEATNGIDAVNDGAVDDNAQVSKQAVFQSAKPRYNKRYRIFRLCSCFFPKELVHQVNQKKHNYHDAASELIEGETMIHHYADPKQMKSKFSKGKVYDSKGNVLDVKDTKQPTPEEMSLYQLRAVSEGSTQREASTRSHLESQDTIGGSSVARRRLTFTRTESGPMPSIQYADEGLYARHRGKMFLPESLLSAEQLEARRTKPKKSVRVFPIVRITVVENFENFDTEDWDLDKDCKTLRAMKKSDLWYLKSDIKSFRRSLREEMNNDYDMIHDLKVSSRHALIWFQTFGKFFGECGDQFSLNHEITMFGYPLNNIRLPERYYQEAFKEIGPTPMEYRNWEDGKYFTKKTSHGDLVTTDMPTHAEYERIHLQAGTDTLPMASMSRKENVSEIDENYDEGSSESTPFGGPIQSRHPSLSTVNEVQKKSFVVGVASITGGSEKSPPPCQAKRRSSAARHNDDVIRRSSSVTRISVDYSKQRHMLNLAKSSAADAAADYKNAKGEQKASSAGTSRNKFLDLDDDVDLNDQKAQSFRIVRTPPLTEGGEEGGVISALRVSGSTSKYADRNKSLRNLIPKNMAKNERSALGTGSRKYSAKIHVEGDEYTNYNLFGEPGEERVNFLEMKMDVSGAAVIFADPDRPIHRADSSNGRHENPRIMKAQTSKELGSRLMGDYDYSDDDDDDDCLLSGSSVGHEEEEMSATGKQAMKKLQKKYPAKRLTL